MNSSKEEFLKLDARRKQLIARIQATNTLDELNVVLLDYNIVEDFEWNVLNKQFNNTI